MIYWYYKRLMYAPSLDVQQRHREEVFKEEKVIKIGTGTSHPCTSLKYFNELKSGDIVGMSSVVMLSTRLEGIHHMLKAAHEHQIWLYIHDIEYDDRPGSNNRDYELIEKFLNKYITYAKSCRNKKKGTVGRPGYHFEDLTLDQKNVILDFRNGLMSVYDAQKKLTDLGLYISKRVVYKLQKQVDLITGKQHKKKKKSWADT